MSSATSRTSTIGGGSTPRWASSARRTSSILIMRVQSCVNRLSTESRELAAVAQALRAGKQVLTVLCVVWRTSDESGLVVAGSEACSGAGGL